MGMGVAEIILYIFTVFFLFYSMRAFLQARSKEFGILLHLGMAKRQLNRLIFIRDDDYRHCVDCCGNGSWIYVFEILLYDCPGNRPVAGIAALFFMGTVCTDNWGVL